MKDNALSITAFAILIISILSTIVLISFSDGIRKVEWLNIESLALGCFALSILGCLLGWVSFKMQLGKVSALLGTVVVAGFLFQLLRGSDPSAVGYQTDQPVSVESSSSNNPAWNKVWNGHNSEESEQGVAPQSATRSERESESSIKTQPESEDRTQ